MSLIRIRFVIFSILMQVLLLFGFEVNARPLAYPGVKTGGEVETTSVQKLIYNGESHAPISVLCTPDEAWSGTREDLIGIVKKAEQLYGFENSKHLGRNATMLIPATLSDMGLERERGNIDAWKIDEWDGYHDPDHNPQKGDGTIKAIQLKGTGNIVKYTNSQGGEVIYNATTGEIIRDEHLGTRNFENAGIFTYFGHKSKDINPHKRNAQYKYVGILYAINPLETDVFYIVDGQTGKRMTNRQVQEFPTTLSDMWKGMGLVCVGDDSGDIIPPKVDSQQENSPKIMTEVSRPDDILQPKTTLTTDDVRNALREDGSGAKKVSEALR